MGFWASATEFNLKAHALALFLVFSLCSHQSLAANEIRKTSDVEDVIATHHFIMIGDIFTDGTDKFLCVETEAHEYGLWNPKNDHLSTTTPEVKVKDAPLSDKCTHSGLHGLGTNQELNHMMVNMLPIGGIKPNDSSHANFSAGATLSLKSDPYSKFCGPNLSSYFVLTRRDGTLKSFYIVVRFKQPQLYAANNCDDSGDAQQTLMVQFDSIWQLSSVDLGNGKTLLFSYAATPRPPVILIVKAIPDSLWSDENVFIIPENLLKPLLMKNGSNVKDLTVRYSALLTVIGKHH